MLDTNVLLSHFSFLERAFQELLAYNGSEDQFELMVVVPWIVLNELDHLKDSSHGKAARYALKRINLLTSQRDSVINIQSAAMHERTIDTVLLPDQSQSLRNDNFILQTCIYFDASYSMPFKERGYQSYVVLISNDMGLKIRSKANGVICLKAVDFAVTRKKLLQVG